MRLPNARYLFESRFSPLSSTILVNWKLCLELNIRKMKIIRIQWSYLFIAVGFLLVLNSCETESVLEDHITNKIDLSNTEATVVAARIDVRRDGKRILWQNLDLMLTPKGW